MAARNLLWLGRLTGDAGLAEKGEEILQTFSGQVSQHPWAHTYFLLAAMSRHYAGKNIIITGDYQEETAGEMVSLLNQAFAPDTTLVLKTSQDTLLEELFLSVKT